MKPRIQLAVSIDTEEDNWKPVRGSVALRNVLALPEHHRFLRTLGLRPTYFVDYAVAANDEAAGTIAKILDSGGAEVGAHLHPWNTPPLEEDDAPRNTMMKNLPAALQRAKLETLQGVLSRILGRRATTFRAGRFGLGVESVAVLAEAGFDVDSSVTPDVDWRPLDDGADYTGAPRHCYRLGDGVDPSTPVADGPVIEVPISTGFTRFPFAWRYRLRAGLARPPLHHLRLNGLLSALGVVREVRGNPETDTQADLVALARALIDAGYRHLLLVWHSPSLLPGLSPFIRSQTELHALRDRIAGFCDGLTRFAEVEAATVREIATSASTARQVP